jgi:hypothetical protein
LHCGDAVTMAADAVRAYTADVAAGWDALLVTDTKEMAAALNQRLHHQHCEPEAATVTVAGGQRVGVGDLILSRRNDPTIALGHPTMVEEELGSVRNGNRWRVAGIDATTNRVAAERLDDQARVVFDDGYLREHVSLGYAVTVHSAQGVTADTCHAVLGESTSRNLLYVAMTRGRRANLALLYQRNTEDREYQRQSDQPQGVHVAYRGDAHDAADMIRCIIANHDQPAITAHDYATNNARHQDLPDHVQALLERRDTANQQLQQTYREWHAEVKAREARYLAFCDRTREHDQHRSQSRDYGLEL